MKHYYFIIIVVLTVFSCSNDQDNENFNINGKFYYDIPNCVIPAYSEINCTEIVWFNSNGKTASIMLGGDDFGWHTEYKIINNEIHFYYYPGNKAEVSFKIINNNTLERLENNNIWNKEEE